MDVALGAVDIGNNAVDRLPCAQLGQCYSSTVLRPATDRYAGQTWWARVQGWLGDQLQNVEPLIARRLGQHDLLALIGSVLLAFIASRAKRWIRMWRWP